MRSQAAEGDAEGSWAERAIGESPKLKIKIGGAELMATVDTGSQVTTVTESFVQRELMQVQPLRKLSWFRLTAANGLEIPLAGYLVADINIMGKTLKDQIVMVLKESPGRQSSCLLGMNIIKNIPSLNLGSAPAPQAPPNSTKLRMVRAESATVIPANSLTMIGATCCNPAMTTDVLVESSAVPPRPGLFVLPSFAKVERGRTAVPIVNTTGEDFILPRHQLIGTAGDASRVHQVTIEVNSAETSNWSSTYQAGDVRGDKGCDIDRTLLAEMINPDLPAGDRARLEHLVRENRDVFAWSDSDLGFTDLVKHRIVLTDDIPVRQSYRRIPPSTLREVESHIQDLLERGIIQPSASPYATPIVVVRKKNGELRLCCDYRKLNAKTRRDSYPLPRIDECLDALGGAQHFSTLDLASGYHQVAMAPEDKHKTTFICPFGTYEWNRMPFGLCNAPATFQRLMQSAMSQHIFRILLVYLDDLLVYSDTFDKHLESLSTVFQRLREVGVKLNPNKCGFAKAEVAFLGHRISADGIATDPEKTRAVMDFPTPQTLRDVRSFVGLASYYRRFVKGFASIARPLHSLISAVHEKHHKDHKKGERKPLKELWTKECDSAFRTLRNALSEPPVLAYADYSSEFILETDACQEGLGAILSQKDKDGRVRVIAYASRTVRAAEVKANYSALKLELLALKWAVTEKFRGYLLGQSFTAYTDNNPLAHMETAKFGAVEQRWIAELAVFQFKILYKPGRNNKNADALSRNPVDPPPTKIDDCVAVSQVRVEAVEVPSTTRLPPALAFCEPITVNRPSLPMPEPLASPFNPAEMSDAQHADPGISPLFPFLKSKTLPPKDVRDSMHPDARPYLRQLSKLQLVDGVLEKKVVDVVRGEISVVVVPVSLRLEALRLAHDQCGHQGPDRTLQLLQTRCYWPSMRESVAEACRRCQRCLQAKRPVVPIHQPIGHLSATKPFEVVAMDFIKLEPSSSNIEDVLIITDVFTKWTVAVPTPNQTAGTVVKALLNNWILHYGVPLRIHSDQGRCFESQVVEQLCQRYNIQKSRTSTYHPQGNGQCERFNRSMISLLSTLTPEEKRRWPDYLPTLVFWYNSTTHATTGQSPYQLLFGREPILPLDLYFGRREPLVKAVGTEALQKHIDNLNLLRRRAQERVTRLHNQQSDSKRTRVHLQPGDQVLMKLHPLGRHKIGDRYESVPRKVISIPAEDGGPFVISGPKPVRVSGSNLKKYFPPLPQPPAPPRQRTITKVRDTNFHRVLEPKVSVVTGCPRQLTSPAPMGAASCLMPAEVMVNVEPHKKTVNSGQPSSTAVGLRRSSRPRHPPDRLISK